MSRCLLFIACALIVTAAGSRAQGEEVVADTLLRGGLIIDGAGGEPFMGDVALAGDRIVAVGEVPSAPGAREIDCRGLYITPGYIDLHNHSDAGARYTDEATGEEVKSRQILAPGRRESLCYLTQGCTTLVTGNCGGGALKVGEYYDQIDATPVGINVAHLIPQGPVREAVIGNTRRAPVDDELVRMQELVRQGMLEGAWGMTTGLQYVPSAYAETDELIALSRVVNEHGGIYASHIRDEGDMLVESVNEAIDIARGARLPVHVSHFKASKRRNWGKVRVAAAVIEEARAEGLVVTADQYPYDASSTSIAAMLLPDEEREGDSEEFMARLEDPEQIARLKPMIGSHLEQRGKIMVAGNRKHPEWIGKMIRQIAEEEDRDPVDVSLDLIKSYSQGVSFSMDERDVRWIMHLPWVATASDGGVKIPDGTNPHPRSYGTFPRKIGYFSIQEDVIPVEQAVRSASGLPADIIGMPERGYLKQGYFADVVVLDPAAFRDQATFQSPFELSTGARWVFVNGEVAIDNGEPKSISAGRALRKKQALASMN